MNMEPTSKEDIMAELLREAYAGQAMANLQLEQAVQRANNAEALLGAVLLQEDGVDGYTITQETFERLHIVAGLKVDQREEGGQLLTLMTVDVPVQEDPA